MPTIMAEVALNGSNATNSGYHNAQQTIDLTHITVERTAPSVYQTLFTLWVDSMRVYPTFGVGLLGEKSEGVIHHHPLPRTRVSKGQDIEFRFDSVNLPDSACPDQSIIITLVADYVNPDEPLAGRRVAMAPYVVESYKTENILTALGRFWNKLFDF